MNYINSDILKKSIMTRIYILFAIEKLKNPLALEIFVLGLSLLILGFLVSLQNVFINASNNLDNFYHFWTSAFLGTKLSVKTLVLVAVLIMGLFVKNAAVYMYINTSRLLARA